MSNVEPIGVKPINKPLYKVELYLRDLHELDELIDKYDVYLTEVYLCGQE